MTTIASSLVLLGWVLLTPPYGATPRTRGSAPAAATPDT
jgi:hypothetical protein